MIPNRDNIVIEKLWEDNTENFFEMRITACSRLATAIQESCYESKGSFREKVQLLRDFGNNHTRELYIEFGGGKTGRVAPAMSLNLIPLDTLGHLHIEVDIEILDTDDKSHGSIFFVDTEIGLLERFAERLIDLGDSGVGTTVALTPRF